MSTQQQTAHVHFLKEQISHFYKIFIAFCTTFLLLLSLASFQNCDFAEVEEDRTLYTLR